MERQINKKSQIYVRVSLKHNFVKFYMFKNILEVNMATLSNAKLMFYENCEV